MGRAIRGLMVLATGVVAVGVWLDRASAVALVGCVLALLVMWVLDNDERTWRATELINSIRGKKKRPRKPGGRPSAR